MHPLSVKHDQSGVGPSCDTCILLQKSAGKGQQGFSDQNQSWLKRKVQSVSSDSDKDASELEQASGSDSEGAPCCSILRT